VNGDQVGIIGLGARITGLTELFGGKRMDDADFKAGRGEGVLRGMVIAAGAFDGDDDIAQIVPGHGLTQLSRRRRQGGPVMLDDGGWNQDIAIEVAQHPLGAGLGTIDADNAKMLRSDLLDARVNDAARLLQDLRTTARRAFTAASNGHSTAS
jgi:hypothetical protein